MPPARPRRIGAAALLVTTSMLFSGCSLLSDTPPPADAAASVTPEPTPSPSVEPVQFDHSYLPEPVAPPVEVTWKDFSDKRTKIRFKLPHRPYKHKDDYVASYGGHIVSTTYAVQYRVAPDHTPVTIVISPYTVSGAVYTTGQTFFQSIEKGLKDNGQRDVLLSHVTSGTVKSHDTVYGTITFQTHDRKKRAYRRLALITGPSWRLYVTVYLDDRKVTRQDKKDTDHVLDEVLDGLRLTPPKA